MSIGGLEYFRVFLSFLRTFDAFGRMYIRIFTSLSIASLIKLCDLKNFKNSIVNLFSLFFSEIQAYFIESERIIHDRTIFGIL